MKKLPAEETTRVPGGVMAPIPDDETPLPPDYPPLPGGCTNPPTE